MLRLTASALRRALLEVLRWSKQQQELVGPQISSFFWICQHTKMPASAHSAGSAEQYRRQPQAGCAKIQGCLGGSVLLSLVKHLQTVLTSNLAVSAAVLVQHVSVCPAELC
jgi:hypothetical protein